MTWFVGATENAGPETLGLKKNKGWKWRTCKLKDQIAGQENDGPGKWWTKSQGRIKVAPNRVKMSEWPPSAFDYRCNERLESSDKWAQHQTTEEKKEYYEWHTHKEMHSALWCRVLQPYPVPTCGQSQLGCPYRRLQAVYWQQWQRHWHQRESTVNSTVSSSNVVSNHRSTSSICGSGCSYAVSSWNHLWSVSDCV